MSLGNRNLGIDEEIKASNELKIELQTHINKLKNKLKTTSSFREIKEKYNFSTYPPEWATLIYVAITIDKNKDVFNLLKWHLKHYDQEEFNQRFIELTRNMKLLPSHEADAKKWMNPEGRKKELTNLIEIFEEKYKNLTQLISTLENKKKAVLHLGYKEFIKKNTY
jgi:hypothetical protein